MANAWASNSLSRTIPWPITAMMPSMGVNSGRVGAGTCASPCAWPRRAKREQAKAKKTLDRMAFLDERTKLSGIVGGAQCVGSIMRKKG